MTTTEAGQVSSFRRYDHLERLGHRSVDHIEIGLVHVFPKLDGTNSSVWWGEAQLRTASRRRVIVPTDDNAGFAQHIFDSVDLWLPFLHRHTQWIVYGEWMVPHTLKTYRDEAWRKFWIFDVYDRERESYVPYEEYAAAFEEFEGFHVIEPLCTIQDPSEEQLRAQVETNTYLIADGAGLGEGVVLKNYTWRESGRPWAKVVRNAFKEENRRSFGTTEKGGAFQVENAISEEFVTAHLVGKTRAKVLLDIANEKGEDVSEPNWQQRIEAEHRGRVIPQLLGRIWHDLIDEEMWAILKKHKGASIDFKKLQGRVTVATKGLAADLFA